VLSTGKLDGNEKGVAVNTTPVFLNTLRTRWRLLVVLLLAACAAVIAVASAALQPSAVTNEEQRRIELYSYAGDYTLQSPPPDVHPAVFMVPQEFRWGSTRNVARVSNHAWGIQILTYYPGFSSPAAPQNKEFGLNCVGYCNGRILMYVSYNPAMVRDGIANFADANVRGQLSSRKFITDLRQHNATFKDLGPRGPFTGGFEHLVLGAQHIKHGLDEQVLWRENKDGHYDLVARCRPNAPNPICFLDFSVSCNPAISVQVTVGMRDIDRAADIKDKANAFLLPMIKSCNP
jgi:hypothetical protein